MSNNIEKELKKVFLEKSLLGNDAASRDAEKRKNATGKERLQKAVAENLAGSSGRIGDKSRKYQDRGMPSPYTSDRISGSQSTYRPPEYSTATINAYRDLNSYQNSGVIRWLNSSGAALTIPLSGGSGFASSKYSVDSPAQKTPTTFLKTTALEDT